MPGITSTWTVFSKRKNFWMSKNVCSRNSRKQTRKTKAQKSWLLSELEAGIWGSPWIDVVSANFLNFLLSLLVQVILGEIPWKLQTYGMRLIVDRSERRLQQLFTSLLAVVRRDYVTSSISCCQMAEVYRNFRCQSSVGDTVANWRWQSQTPRASEALLMTLRRGNEVKKADKKQICG